MDARIGYRDVRRNMSSVYGLTTSASPDTTVLTEEQVVRPVACAIGTGHACALDVH